MKKVILISGLFLFACLACENREFIDRDLLVGKWQLQEETVDNPLPYIPVIDFYANGEYKMTEYVNPPLTLPLLLVTVTGDFITYNNKIEFTTAIAEAADKSSGDCPAAIEGTAIAGYYGNLNNESALHYSGTGSTIITGEYKPVIWTVIELSEDIMQVAPDPFDTIVYKKVR